MKSTNIGRSMVEMLGVLSVVGILSIGGMTLYGKSNTKSKVTNSIAIVTDVLSRIAQLDQMGMTSLVINTADKMKEHDIFPNCKKFDEESCEIPVGYLAMDFSFHPEAYYSKTRPANGVKAIYVAFTKGDTVNACIDFLSAHDWRETLDKTFPKHKRGNNVTFYQTVHVASTQYSSEIYNAYKKYEACTGPDMENYMPYVPIACRNACQNTKDCYIIFSRSVVTVLSDARLKTNKQLLAEVDGYKVYSFNYIYDNVPHVGVMAQEVLPLCPECVISNYEGTEFYAVNYGKLPQSVQNKIEELSKEISKSE